MLPLPAFLVANLIEPAYDLYEGSRRLREFRSLMASQWRSWDELQALQSERLQAMVRHAVDTVPFHARRFAEAGIDPATVRTIDDLAALPLLTKADIRGRQQDLLCSRYPRERLVKAKTGGSTGVALEIYCDETGVQRRNAAALRGDHWSGWRLGQPIAAVWGNPPVPRTWKSKLRRAVKDRYFFLDTMKLDRPAVERFVADWRRHRPGLLYGHAHSIFLLAEALHDLGVDDLRPGGIVATSMMLLQPERRVIEEVFRRPVTDRYGCEEVSLIGCECEQHRGMHLNSEHTIVEFLRDDGSPCAPGEDGRIVVTELVNLGMPMLRYEVGDRGAPGDGIPCACGRGLPLMTGLTGRTADFLVALDGSRVAGISLIENTLTRFAGLRQMQLVQDEPDRVVANVVKGRSYDADTERQLVAALQGYLGGDGMRVDVVPCERIAQEANGKYRFAICRVPR
ncbi:MAG: phenylacetate--CoA ligase family protein [Candidatus Krumholzibacteriia bacterium]